MTTDRITADNMPDARIERAISHCQAVKAVEQVTGRKRINNESHTFHTYLAGFDAGMEVAGSGELLHEATQLHNWMSEQGLATDAEKLAVGDLRCACEMVAEDEGFGGLNPLVREVVMSALKAAKGDA